MENLVNLSFKVPEEIHKKLKVISALSGKSMSDIIVDFVISQKISIPNFDNIGKKTKSRKTKTTKTKSNINPDYDKEAVKEKILSLNAAGSNPADIARTLEAEGILTATGLSEWNRGTISNMIKGWTAQ